VHARDLLLPKGVESTLHKDENPVVATCILPALITEEETAAAEAVPAAAEVPTTAQAAPEKAEEAAAGDKAKAGDKGADKAADKKEKK
jgi:hypothetical protein